jgi:PAS domain S-box-containing protein
MLRPAVEHTPIGMALLSPDGRWIGANPALCGIVWRSQTDLLRLTFRDITHRDDDVVVARIRTTPDLPVEYRSRGSRR